MFNLPSTPFDPEKVGPLFTPKAIEYHHGKHHSKYVANLNKLVKGTTYKSSRLEDLCDKNSGKIFENAAQHWNHSFFWHCISEKEEQPPNEFELFEEDFINNGMKIFGSGWWWIAWHREDAKIHLYDTPNARTLGQSKKDLYIPVLVADIWEHCYYPDYWNDRRTYLQNLWKQFNWDFAKENLKRAKEEDKKWTL